MDFSTTAFSVLSLCLLAIPGFILVKIKVLKAEHIGTLVVVLLYVCQPMITVNAFVTKEYESSMLANMGWIALAGFLSQLFMLALAKLCFSFDRGNKLRANAYSYASALGNVGFMGIPVVSVIMPGNSEALLYVSLFMVTFNIICWTVGVYVLTGDRKFISLKKAFINPPVIAIIIALPFFFLNVRLPEAILTPINFLAEMNTPLAMVILGMRFAVIRFRDLFSGWGVYLCCLLKLVVCPLVVYGVLKLCNFTDTVYNVILILCAMPAANMVLMMAERYDGDAVSSAKAVLLSTLFSIVTIPLIMMLP